MVQSRCVLLVDDDQDELFLFSEALTSVDESIRLYSANDGYDALKTLHTTQPPPDLIFLDLNMPRLNGIEFLSKVKESKRLSDIPVIIYSTSGAHEHKERTSALGAAHYMVKQNSFKDLCQELSQVLSASW
jgi:CheY-like chemotaxis protein